MKKPTFVLFIALLIPLITSGQFVLGEWNFSEPADSILGDAANSGTGSLNWNAEATFAGTMDGAGNLVLGRADSSIEDDITPINNQIVVAGSSPAIGLMDGSGDLSLTLDVGAWKLESPDLAFRQFGIAFRDPDAPAGAARDVINIQVNQTAAGVLRIRTRVNGSSWSIPDAFNETAEIPGSFSITLNLNTGTGAYDMLVDSTSVASGTATLGGLANFMFYAQSNTFDTGDDFVNLDKLTYTASVPEPVAMAMIGGIAALGLVLYSRRR